MTYGCLHLNPVSQAEYKRHLSLVRGNPSLGGGAFEKMIGGVAESKSPSFRMFRSCRPFLFAALAAFAAATISDCGAGKSLFTITELSQSPADTVSAGENTTLTLLYTAPEEIPAGTATKSVTLNFIPFSPTVEDLCANAPCPITVGDHDGSSWYLFPSGVSGTLVSKVVWADDQGRQLLCIQSKYSVKAPLALPAPEPNATSAAEPNATSWWESIFGN